jgi:hypothetical protein
MGEPGTDVEAQIRADVLALMAPVLVGTPEADVVSTMLLPAYTKFAMTMKGLMSEDFGPFSEDKLRAYLDRALEAVKTCVLDHPAVLRPAAAAGLIHVIGPFDTFGVAPEDYPSYRAALEDWYTKLDAQKSVASSSIDALIM